MYLKIKVDCLVIKMLDLNNKVAKINILGIVLNMERTFLTPFM